MILLKQNHVIFSTVLALVLFSNARAHTGAPSPSSFNPSMSVNVLGLYEHSSQDSTQRGFSLQEVEMQFMADVDTYFKANALLSVSQDKSGAWGIDPEEVFAETSFLPSLTLKFGKFKAAFGKHNLLHAHAYPFIDAPLIHQSLLGDEGLNDAGVSASALISFIPWFSEFTLQALSSKNISFKAPNKDALTTVAHLKNLWDLSDSLTFEFGLSGAFGANTTNQTTSLLGADLSFKYRPVAGGKYHSIQWTTEYLNGNRRGFSLNASSMDSLAKLDGLASWLLYQFAERWWTGIRGEIEGLSQSGNLEKIQRGSLILGFSATEFSSFRLAYDYIHDPNSQNDHRIALQMNLTLGAHPAHSY